MSNVDLTSIDKYAIGIKYKMDVELSPLVVKDATGKPIANEKVFNEYTALSFVNAGGFNVETESLRFNRRTVTPIRSDFGNKLGTKINEDAPYVNTETGKRHVGTRGRSEDIAVHIVNEGVIDSRIASISQHGRFIQN